MSTLELVWYACVAFVCLYAISDWRNAIYPGILIDVIRDPVRKLVHESPIAITLSGVVPWAIIVVVAASSHRHGLREMYRQYPKLRTATSLLMLALLPAAIISTVSYTRGWMMAGVGAISYLVPAIGVAAGFALLKNESGALRILKWYVIVNSIMLVSVPFEYLGLDVPGLGGIQFEWIRNRTGYNVNLIAGWYRSPDIMGLHAAHTIMFSLLLSNRSRSEGQFAWLVPALWAGFCVLVSGRRKMIGIPLVFLAFYLFLGIRLGMRKVGRLTGFAVIAVLAGSAIAIIFWSPDEAAEYTNFAVTLFTEGVGRSNEMIVGSTVVTLQQVGLLGGGLGTATQGRYYTGVQTARHLRGWQEDGVSRLFLEFGVPGVLLLLVCLFFVLATMGKALRATSKQSNEQILQVGLISVVAGDAASFAISHQQFSGDPVSALFVTLMIGMVLRLPLLSPTNRPAIRQNTLPTQNQNLPAASHRKESGGSALPPEVKV